MREESAKQRLHEACDLCAFSGVHTHGTVGESFFTGSTVCERKLGLVHRGQHLVRAGDAFGGMFLVQSGCFKVYVIDRTGREYIHGFRFQGTLLGLHSLTYGRGVHIFNVVAMTTSTVCKINYPSFISMAAQIPELNEKFLRAIGQTLAGNLFLSGNFTAEERVASFLLMHADRLQVSDGQDNLRLPMSRSDIAIYLRLALSTVSRILSRLRQEGVIDADYHHIHILDRTRLSHMCKNVPFVTD